MAIPSFDELQVLHSRFCQAVADPKRIQIMYALNEGPLHVTALAELLEMPQPTASRHLSILRQRGLVSTQREGSTVIYSLAEPTVIHIIDQMRDLVRVVLEKQADKLH